MRRRFNLSAVLVLPLVVAQNISPPPGQPTHPGDPGKFEIIGNTLVSSQQIFLGRPDKVYILDKVQNNPAQVNGHPAWASEYKLSDNSQRAMDVVTNTFCAGGSSLGNGTWINVGGNQAVTTGGLAADSQDGTSAPYHDADGRDTIRLLDPCDDNKCNWVAAPSQIEKRWYPTVETLEDGSVIILGGCLNGGYVNDAAQTNPTYEFFPATGSSYQSPILQNTLPANLYPLTWLLPSGNLLVQSNWQTSLLDYKSKTETPLEDMVDAVRTYPASGGSVMMPLTPGNNWTATIMFCGGSNIAANQWTASDFIVVSQPASPSCVKITPDVSPSYIREDPLPEGRSMANMILLPDGKFLLLNGARMGTAGYGNTTWSVGQSYADDPAMTPVLYDPAAPAGSRWSTAGFAASIVPRMYHSSALLLADGSIFVSGSNPNADFTGSDARYGTEYRTERFYPPYYSKRRPMPKGIITKLSYGGAPFEIFLDSYDLLGDVGNVAKASVVIIRQGFSTHSMNMGQRMVVLESTYTGFSNNTAVLHVAQVPPNPAILAPGPAMLFVVINGVPSIGVQIMVGSGEIGPQTTLPIGGLPPSAMIQNMTGATTPNSGSGSVAGRPTKSSAIGGGIKEGSLGGWIAVGTMLLAMANAVIW